MELSGGGVSAIRSRPVSECLGVCVFVSVCVHLHLGSGLRTTPPAEQYEFVHLNPLQPALLPGDGPN